MKFWQTIRRFLSTAWIAEVAWPLRIVRGVLALYLVFGLTAAVVWLGFGRSAEKQVVDVAERLSTIALIFLVPLFLFALIVVPLHRRSSSQVSYLRKTVIARKVREYSQMSALGKPSRPKFSLVGAARGGSRTF